MRAGDCAEHPAILEEAAPYCIVSPFEENLPRWFFGTYQRNPSLERPVLHHGEDGELPHVNGDKRLTV